MGVYKKAIITDAGEALRARAVAGEANMQFSCAKTSTYVYPDGTDLTKLTDLQEIRQTVVPSNVQINTSGTATTQDVLELEQKKVNGNGGDISETVIAATEKSQAEYPVPAAGDSAKTILGKVQKFFGDLRNWMTGVCLLGQIVNNCVTDNAKLPLSAAQGKVLMDLYNVLNTKAKNMQRSYLGNLGNVASGSVTLPGLSRCKWLIIVPYGGQPSAPAIIVGGGIRFSGVATDANIASIYEVGFRITGDTLTFSFNKAYSVPGGTEFQMTFGDVYGIIE